MEKNTTAVSAKYHHVWKTEAPVMGLIFVFLRSTPERPVVAYQ